MIVVLSVGHLLVTKKRQTDHKNEVMMLDELIHADSLWNSFNNDTLTLKQIQSACV